jgi:hypothetical protein
MQVLSCPFVQIAEVVEAGGVTRQPQHKVGSHRACGWQGAGANKLEKGAEDRDEKSDVAVWRNQLMQDTSLRSRG